MKRFRVIAVVGFIAVIIVLYCGFSARGRLLMKFGFNHAVIWEKDFAEYNGTVYLIEKDDSLAFYFMEHLFSANAFGGLTEDVGVLCSPYISSSRLWAENSKIHNERLCVFAQKADEAKSYHSGNFTYKGLTDVSVTCTDGALVIECISSAEKYSDAELYKIGISFAECGNAGNVCDAEE